MDRHDERMIQLSGAARLAEEAVHLLGRRQSAGPRDFQGHDAIELEVAGAIDDTESAAAQLLEQLVLADPREATRTGPRDVTIRPDGRTARGASDHRGGRLQRSFRLMMKLQACLRVWNRPAEVVPPSPGGDQFQTILWESFQEFRHRQHGLAATAQLQLGCDQLELGPGVALQLGESLQVLLDPHRLAVREPIFQIGVDHLE